MLTNKRIGTAVTVVLAVVLGLATTAGALTSSDRGAGLIVVPNIKSEVGIVDTLIQLSNLGTVARTAKCFYVNANSHCVNNGNVCFNASECIDPGSGIWGACVPDCAVTDFFVVLTQEQPLGWSVSGGLSGSDTPLRGRVCSNLPRLCVSDAQCPGGTCLPSQTNAGTFVPPAPEDPFTGALYCAIIDPTTGVPSDVDNPNDLKAEATLHVVSLFPLGRIEVATSNAVGFRATGTGDGNNRLSIGADPGGFPEEYIAAPSVLVLDHLFDGAVNPIDDSRLAATFLTLVPCTADLSGANPEVGNSTAQFLVFNEYEQRFSTSRRVSCVFESLLSLIDTTQPNRSIFSAGVSGTVAGQTRIRPVGGGLVGSAWMVMTGPEASIAAYNLHQDNANRTQGDHINIP